MYICLSHSQDLAIGEVLRKYDASVESDFGDKSASLRAIEEEVEKRESDILETARLDMAWAIRCVTMSMGVCVCHLGIDDVLLQLALIMPVYIHAV